MNDSVKVTCLGIVLRNFQDVDPQFNVYTPLDYTLLDVVTIVKLLTGYSDEYSWKIFFHLGRYAPHNELILRLKGKKIDEIKLSEFLTTNNELFIHYGKIKININNGVGRGKLKQKQKYPVMYNKRASFPTEEEYRKNIKIEDMDRVYKKNEVKDLDKKLKDYFKDKSIKSSEYIFDKEIEWKIVK